MTLGRERLKDLYADMLNAILLLLADEESEIRAVARTANESLLNLVRKTEDKLDFSFLLQKLEDELNNKDETTRIASLSWISMLLSMFPSLIVFVFTHTHTHSPTHTHTHTHTHKHPKVKTHLKFLHT